MIYARYSSHSQREESIEGQLRECRDFADKNDMTVIAEYCDRGISGKTDNRPEFQRLIKDSERCKFDAVIMYTLDRFARNRYDSAIYKAKLKKNGVRIYYAKQPMPDTPEGIILESVLEGYAEYYSENLSRNIKRGLKENALQCIASGGSGLVLGYTIGSDRHYHIDPIGAKIVREIYQRYADGEPVSRIVRYCNTMGYKTSRGNNFTKNSLHNILKNEKYMGTFRYGDVTVPNGMPAIIDKELFDQVQAMRQHNSAVRARTKAKHEYLLTGKLFCGHCGEYMIGESGTSKSGKTYYYYKCSKRKNHNACDKASEKKEWIENLVVRFAVQKVLTDDTIDMIADRAMALIMTESMDESYLNALQCELKTVQHKLDNLLSAIEQGMLNPSIKTRITELEKEQGEIEARIAAENLKSTIITKDHIVFWLNSFKNGDVNDATYRRRIIDTLINAVYVYDGDNDRRKIVFTFNLSGQNTATITGSDLEQFAPLAASASDRMPMLYFAAICRGVWSAVHAWQRYKLPRYANRNFAIFVEYQTKWHTRRCAACECRKCMWARKACGQRRIRRFACIDERGNHENLAALCMSERGKCASIGNSKRFADAGKQSRKLLGRVALRMSVSAMWTQSHCVQASASTTRDVASRTRKRVNHANMSRRAQVSAYTTRARRAAHK